MARKQGPQPPAVPPYPGQPVPRAESWGSQAAGAARAAAAFYRGWKHGRMYTDALDVQRKRQEAKHQAAISAYRSRLNRLRTRFVAGSTAMVGGAALAASSLDGMPAEAPIAVVGASAAAFGTWHAVRSRYEQKRLRAPSPPPAIIGPPPPLPVGSVGAESAARVTSLRMHIMELLPTIDLLHEEAADQVRSVDAATAPGLNALVERIRSMQKIIAGMPASPTAQHAQATIQALVTRLDEGAQAYQELLAAVIGLSGAPALSGPASATLRPAIDDMRAYAAGLERAAQTWL